MHEQLDLDIDRRKNYQKALDKKLENINKKTTLLLHSCCGPCSSYCLEYLSKYFYITVFYYNPNIYPSNEYELRIEEQKTIINATKATYPITLVEGEYDTKKYYQAIKGLELEAEGGKRCMACYELRLKEAAKLCREYGYDYFTTSLTISPHKDAHILNAIGRKMAKRYECEYLDTDFKKKNGYKRSVEISKSLDIYRQDYCGCIFSKKEAEKRNAKS